MPIPGKETSEIAGLVGRARAGDSEAYGDLVERLWAELVALARGVLAADALVHAWRRLWTLRRPESFRPWVRRIVTRRCLSAARRRRPQEPLTETAGDPSSRTADPQPGARLDAARLLGSLAPRQRSALYLTWIEGCTDREAGRLLGLRPATVRVHRHRGLARLRRLVEEDR